MSDNDERDSLGESLLPQDPLGPFDAFRVRRAQEKAANDPFPEQYTNEPTAMLPTEAAPAGRGAVRGRGRLRSVVVLGAVAALVVAGLGVGVYAATQSSSGQSVAVLPAASPGATASATASAGASNAPKYGKAVIAKLTVTAVGPDSFNATTADGANVSVRIASSTKFGTAARPFTRSQLVPGAVVYTRLRRDAAGDIVATVIAAATVDQGSATAAASTGV